MSTKESSFFITILIVIPAILFAGLAADCLAAGGDGRTGITTVERVR